MTRFYQPDLSTDLNSPFIRNLTNDEKRVHLIDLRREHLIDKICIQEVLPPEK